MTHTFLTLSGAVEVERFMQAPTLSPGNVWMSGHISEDTHYWTEETSPHGPESDPNHHSYDMKLFGYAVPEFLAKQYR